jgi:hypothetical protein
MYPILFAIIGIALMATGIFFAIGGVGGNQTGGTSLKDLKVEGPAWLLLVALGLGTIVFSAVWKWDSSDSSGPVTPTTTTIEQFYDPYEDYDFYDDYDLEDPWVWCELFYWDDPEYCDALYMGLIE